MRGTKDRPTYSYKVDGTVYGGGEVIVNNKGPFFNKFSKKGKIGGYDHGFIRSQVLQILHELAHSVLDNGKPLIVDDGSTNSQNQVVNSEDNTDIVKAVCKAEIEASGDE